MKENSDTVTHTHRDAFVCKSEGASRDISSSLKQSSKLGWN